MFTLSLRPLVWLTAGLVLGGTAVAVFDPTPAAPAAPSVPTAVVGPRADNPLVAPGLVKWHASLGEAQDAARVSGRPVLLFHMMGQLDKQFC
ncbi:unnamed protein product [Gemmataceae bacterium]|nr:unnamed protein product [Gemmataceae bacterium]VTT98163.1 unnamed protein product [Gemmataceae bacterium]